MIASKAPFWIRNGKLRRSYVGVGDAYSLYPYLRYLAGQREQLERLAVHLGCRSAAEPLSPRAPLFAAVETAFASLGEVRAALLLDTAYYKDTQFVGPVELADGQRLFLKYFKDKSGASVEEEHAKEAHRLALGCFETAEVVLRQENLVAYQAVDRTSDEVDRRELIARVLQMSAASYQATQQRHSVADLAFFDDAISLARRTVLADGAGQALERIRSRLSPVRLPIAHGDCTPWNVFGCVGGGRICLIDYERTGPFAPFTDRFHLFVQPMSLVGKQPLTLSLIDEVRRAAGVSSEEALGWFVMYLAQELATDTRALVIGEKRHPQLRKLIATKTAIVRRVCAALGEGS